MTEAEKAQIHLEADFLSQIGVGTLLAGGAAPIIEALATGEFPSGYTLGLALMSIAAALVAFFMARDILGRLY